MKNYEQIIEDKRSKVHNAEDTILKLRQEMDILKDTYNKNLNFISKVKKDNHQDYPLKHNESCNKSKENKLSIISNIDKKSQISFSKNDNLNQFIDDLNRQVNDLNKDLDDIKIDMATQPNNKNKFYNNESNYSKNSNDINFRSSNENDKNNLSTNKNRIYTISEEMVTTFKESNNLINKNNSNKVLYKNQTFDKMQGSDIDVCRKLDSGFYSNEETTNNLVF
jgi:hypothetical protein